MDDKLNAASDMELVERSRNGDQQAYGLVVQRYQSLVCSVAYNRCGDLALSEDLAQDAFLQGWKKLADLRDVAGFKPWICTIVRNLSTRAGNRNRKVTQDTLAFASDVASETPSPAEQAVSAEEETLVWQALEEIPESYREPMILFYREDQSVTRVAEGLGLSEDTVKQRLSRGRKMLRQHLAATVETTLVKSRPSKGFTATVVAGIAGLVPSSATAAGTTAASSSVAAVVAKSSAAKLLKTGAFAGAATGLGVMFLSLFAQIPVLVWMNREAEKSREKLSDDERTQLGQMSFERPAMKALRIVIFFVCGAIAYWLSSKWENMIDGYVIFFGLILVCNLPMLLADFKLFKEMRQNRIDAGTHTPPGPLVESDDPRVVRWITLLLIVRGASLVTVWPILLAIYHSDWFAVQVVLLASTAISLIAWGLAMRFPSKAALSCYQSCLVMGLLAIALIMARQGTWSNNLFDFGWTFAAMVGIGMTTAVHSMLILRRIEESPHELDNANLG